MKNMGRHLLVFRSWKIFHAFIFQVRSGSAIFNIIQTWYVVGGYRCTLRIAVRTMVFIHRFWHTYWWSKWKYLSLQEVYKFLSFHGLHNHVLSHFKIAWFLYTNSFNLAIINAIDFWCYSISLASNRSLIIGIYTFIVKWCKYIIFLLFKCGLLKLQRWKVITFQCPKTIQYLVVTIELLFFTILQYKRPQLQSCFKSSSIYICTK